MFARAFTATVVAVGVYLASASPVARQGCSRSYTVVANDTCDGISVKQGVSTYQLLLNNPTVNVACDNLWIDQVLCLASSVNDDCTTLHTVAEGDTCAAILTGAGITLATLRANNANVDSVCGNIYPGEVLCTSNTLIYA